MTDKVLFKAFEDPLRASGLQALAIRGAYRLTDAGIAAAAKAAPGIVSLEVTHSARITSDAAKAVAEACGNKCAKPGTRQRFLRAGGQAARGVNDVVAFQFSVLLRAIIS